MKNKPANKTPIFYISSHGSSATTWLAKVLSQHPLIDCAHAPNWNVKTTDELVLFLINKAQRSAGVSGAIHMSRGHGALLRRYLIDAGGIFVGLLRDPILRISSQFTAKQKFKPNDARTRDIQKQLRNSYPILMRAIELRKDGALDNIELEFARAVILTLRYDTELMTHASRDELFRFEDFTTNLDTFHQLLKILANDHIKIDRTFVKRSFESEIVNRHHSSNVSDFEDVFASWGEIFKHIYIASLIFFNRAYLTGNKYNSFQYSIVPREAGGQIKIAEEALVTAIYGPHKNAEHSS